MNTKMMILTTVLGILVCSFTTNAQMRNEKDYVQEKGHGVQMGKTTNEIPNLTDEQKSKIEALRVPYQKQIQVFQNKMGELKAHQRTLETADKADLKSINANIDEITKVQNQLLKTQAEHHQQIRGLLTDEQKLWFDQRGDHKKGPKNEGKKGHFHDDRAENGPSR
ncbi:MAG: Spy/CpxP family protein refolding chaperone [Breznakibacter sp.]